MLTLQEREWRPHSPSHSPPTPQNSAVGRFAKPFQTIDIFKFLYVGGAIFEPYNRFFPCRQGEYPTGSALVRPSGKGRERPDRPLGSIAGLQRRRRLVRIGPSPPGCSTGEGFGSFGRSRAGLSNRPPILDRQSDVRKNVGLAARRNGDRFGHGKPPPL